MRALGCGNTVRDGNKKPMTNKRHRLIKRRVIKRVQLGLFLPEVGGSLLLHEV
jgi:hypothetical protein